MFVERAQDNSIKGVYRNAQPGYATEFLADNDPAVVAFLAAPATAKAAEDARNAAFLSDVDRQDLISKIVTATPVQIKTYVQNNVTDLASARVLLTKILLLLATAIRR